CRLYRDASCQSYRRATLPTHAPAGSHHPRPTRRPAVVRSGACTTHAATARVGLYRSRSEEHTSELQSLTKLLCPLLLEKKKKKKDQNTTMTNDTDLSRT